MVGTITRSALSRIEIFAAGAHGNVAPAATIKGHATTIADVTSVGTDPSANIYGTNVIDAQNGNTR